MGRYQDALVVLKLERQSVVDSVVLMTIGNRGRLYVKIHCPNCTSCCLRIYHYPEMVASYFFGTFSNGTAAQILFQCDQECSDKRDSHSSSPCYILDIGYTDNALTIHCVAELPAALLLVVDVSSLTVLLMFPIICKNLMPCPTRYFLHFPFLGFFFWF